jgi:hypothetical protein
MPDVFKYDVFVITKANGVLTKNHDKILICNEQKSLAGGGFSKTRFGSWMPDLERTVHKKRGAKPPFIYLRKIIKKFSYL